MDTNEKDRLKLLHKLGSKIDLLYIEDNKGMREHTSALLKKFFRSVYTAENGEEGVRLFRKHKPKIVITDIQMPKLSGLEMSKKIYKISPQTKIIITSSYDDTKYLLEAINIGIFRYMQKPINFGELSTTLLDGLEQIIHEDDERLFQFYIKNIFEHQKNLLILYSEEKAVIANETFLDFFKVDNLEEFEQKHESLGNNFLEHKNFLYDHDNINWFEEAIKDTDKLHHVKMFDSDGHVRHFIFKIIPINDNSKYYLISLDDVTELGLLKLFDEQRTEKDDIETHKVEIIKLLQVAKRNNTKIKMYNLYKGVAIINEGLVSVAKKDNIVLQSAYLQQKAAQIEDKIIISSELFPSDIVCKTIKSVNYEDQTISVDKLKLLSTSPLERKTVRFVPEDEHRVSLFFEEHRFGDDVRIVDVSTDAVKLSLISLPAGLKKNEKVIVDMVFSQSKRPTIINSKGIVYSVEQKKRYFLVVVLLDLEPKLSSVLHEYLAKRQIELIREFKSLKYG